jgi:hypothetical protein
MAQAIALRVNSSWGWAACRSIGRGWVMCQRAAAPVLPALSSFGLAGGLALLAGVAWYGVLHAPALGGRLAASAS